MWTLMVTVMLVINGVAIEEVLVNTSKFQTEELCYAQAKEDAPKFMDVIEKHYGEAVAKTVQITPKCENEGRPA
ncbi:MAG: hypothetical protein E6Q97_28335 [Desulfurellales bacterium]|nr:MAG: hypothetical protein E6Q97_28335 [Desulfurellales bacterium]